jgi:3-dehydroquinate synthase
VFRAPLTRQDLSPRELSAGLAEVSQVRPIADMEFWLARSEPRCAAGLESRRAGACELSSCEIKACRARTSATGPAGDLNFGHTFGHAIESGLGYGEILHWLERDGCGMVMAQVTVGYLGRVDAAFCRNAHPLWSSAPGRRSARAVRSAT